MMKCIIQRDPSGDIMVMHPDGAIEFALNASDARALHDKWAKRAARARSVVVVELEWRGFDVSEVPQT